VAENLYRSKTRWKIMIKIPLLRPYFDGEELKEIQKVLDSGWVSQGPKVEEFEHILAEYLGVKYCIAVCNCTAALHVSLLSVGIRENDEVLVADYTFPATGHAVLYCRARPVFVDVDPRTYNMDPRALEDKISEKAKAVIPVHTFGQPADMDPLMDIAQDYDLKIIEDAACALGARYKNQYVGTMGDVGCFSLHARKGITTGEGGFVVTNDRDIAERIQMLSVFGMTSAWEREKEGAFVISEFREIGYNYKMSDINAAIGIAQMRKLDKIIKRKQALATCWDELLEDIPLIEPPFVNEHVTPVYQSYVPLVDRKIRRDHLITVLGNKGVQATIGTYASHIQPVYRTQDVCPVSLDTFRRAVALPMYYTLGESDIDRAAAALKEALEESQ
jgi:perosamine synthetase